jgi:ribosome biogenesis GTPase A
MLEKEFVLCKKGKKKLNKISILVGKKYDVLLKHVTIQWWQFNSHNNQVFVIEP